MAQDFRDREDQTLGCKLKNTAAYQHINETAERLRRTKTP